MNKLNWDRLILIDPASAQEFFRCVTHLEKFRDPVLLRFAFFKTMAIAKIRRELLLDIDTVDTDEVMMMMMSVCVCVCVCVCVFLKNSFFSAS